MIVAAGGCRAEVEVTIDVDLDGSGRVEVSVAVDKDVTDKLDLRAALRVEDLVQVGWRVTGPDERPGGGATLEATKSFSGPDEAAQVMGEVSGPEGSFRDFLITHDRTFFTSRSGFSGRVDLTKGIEGFADPAVVQALGGPAGLQQLIGQPVAQAVQVQVSVRLPGRSQTWAPVFGQETALRTSAQQVDFIRVAGLGATVVVAAALAIYLAARHRRRAERGA